MNKLFSFCVVAMTLVGCMRSGVTDSDSKVPGYGSISKAAVKIVEQVLSDPRFEKFYKDARAVAKGREHALPAIFVKRPSSLNDDIPTEQMFRELQTAFGRTEKFIVLDYTTIKPDINEPDIGVEPGGLDNFGSYTGKDIVADSQIIRDGGRWFLNMQIRNERKEIAITGNVEIGE